MINNAVLEHTQMEKSRGELNQIYGYEEAERLISKNYFEQYTDSEGEQVFIKKEQARKFTINTSGATELNMSDVLSAECSQHDC